MPFQTEINGIPLVKGEATHQPTAAASINFADLLFDSILMQQSHTKGEADQHSDGLARIDTTYMASAFRIALDTCSSTKGDFRKVLEASSLDQIDRVRSYIVQHKGSNGIFPKDEIVIPDAKDPDYFLIPIASSVTTTLFEDAYAKAGRKDMEMIALIMYQIRTQLDAEAIETKDLNRKLGLAVYSFSPRYFAQRAYNKQLQSQPESFPTQESKVQAAIDQFNLDMGELQIIDHSATRPTYGLQGQLDLPTALTTDTAIDSVSAAADVLFKAQVPSERYIAQRADLTKRLQCILDSAFPGCQLRIEEFGSYVSGLGTDTSDADFCITSDSFDYSAPYSNLENMKAALRSGGMTRIVPLLHARIPIVACIDPVSKIDCDISCHELAGVYGTNFIKCYTLIDPRVKPLAYNIKALVKAHGINDASKGFFTTFTYMMMIIGFLQAQDPPILPSLQAQPKAQLTERLVQNQDEAGGKDFIDYSFVQDTSRYKDFGAANTKPVGQLLIEFFECYSRYFDYQSLEVNVRLGGFVIREEVSKQRALGIKQLSASQREKKLYVTEPFTGRNLTGNCSARNLTQIWRTFQWLYYQLSQGHHQQALAPIPNSYFRFEVQITEHMQTRASKS